MKTYQDKQLLNDLYARFQSQVKIAEYLGCNHKTIAAWMKKFDIGTVGTQGARKRQVNHSYFKRIDTEEKAYWFGFLMADGCVYRGSGSYSYRLQINLKQSDRDVLVKFQQAIGSDYKISDKMVNESYVSQIKINSTEMCEDLMRHGIVPRKSLICQFPILPDDLMRHFIRGFFDGDGCITSNIPKDCINPRWKIDIVGGAEFLEDLSKYLIDKINVDTKIYDIKHSRAKSLSTHKHQGIEKLYHFFYQGASCFLERKRTRFEEFMIQLVPFRSNPVEYN